MIKKYRPTSAGTRFKEINVFEPHRESGPEKTLTLPHPRTGGRNHRGKMTIRYHGGGHKRLYRVIDFRRAKQGMAGVVKRIEYDPNRSARIALIHYPDGEKQYILAPNGLQPGRQVLSGKGAPPEPGNALFLSDIPFGTIVHNVEMRPGEGGVLARGAGTYAQVLAREGEYATVKLPSGETRLLLSRCMASIGAVSNADHNLQVIGKAGANRWRGIRPRTRGVAMNPVDHPMGGGEGKASGGHPRSRKGIPAKGHKTRNRKNRSSRFIIERRTK